MQLEALAEEARNKRMSGDFCASREPAPLDGYCFQNALVVYHLLKDYGYDCEMVVGYAEHFAEEIARSDIDPETVDDLGGLGHYWVEIDREIVIDISPELSGYNKNYYVGERPTTYHVLQDSYLRGENVLNNTSFCKNCGGHNPDDCPCGR